MARPLNSDGQLPLMLGAIPRNTAGKDLPSLGNVLAKFSALFVIYAFNLINTESADSLTRPSVAITFHLIPPMT